MTEDGLKLRAALAATGMSLRKFSKLSGIPFTTLSNWLRLDILIPAADVDRIAATLGIAPEVFTAGGPQRRIIPTPNPQEVTQTQELPALVCPCGDDYATFLASTVSARTGAKYVLADWPEDK